jgi:hypothetical protein
MVFLLFFRVQVAHGTIERYSISVSDAGDLAFSTIARIRPFNNNSGAQMHKVTAPDAAARDPHHEFEDVYQ